MKIFIASAVAFFLAIPSLSAVPSYRFTIIGDAGYYFYYSFDLPVTPIKSQIFDKSLDEFDLHNITINTVSDPFQGDVWFFQQAQGGGLEVDTAGNGDDILLATNGATLFSWNIGQLASIVPTFKTGTFTLSDWYDTELPTPIDLHSYTLTIGLAANAPPPPPAPPLAIPEPESWALMLCGFGAIGGAMRMRRRMRVRFG